MNNSVPTNKFKIKNQILHLIKTQGPQSAAALAEQLQVTPMAIRQHLQDLQSDEWVIYEEKRRPVGRPIKLWQLTEQAAQLFPDSHGELTVNLLQNIEQVFGAEGLEALIAKRMEQQIQNYAAQISNDWNWRDRVQALAQIRSQEGYMAEVVEASEQAVLLVENHCSIYSAAQSCQLFCGSELAIFAAVLGQDIHIDRVEHIMQGDRRCAYRISVSN